MTHKPGSLLLLLLAGVGCATQSQFEPYYDTWAPPSVSALSVTSEAGNIGGGTVEITGSGFGTDASKIVVQFGDDNADILAIEDGRLEVRVPQGPITGGAVEVRIATPTGFTTAADSYVYDVGALYAEQIGHIQINNFWESCLGGQSDRIDEAYGTTGCQDVSYLGYVGIDGVAEALSFVYPRLHSENIGFFGGTDQAGSEWVIERPGQIGYAFGVEDLHQDIGAVTLENEIWDGDAWCPELDSLASYRYGGGVEGYADPVSVTGADVISGANCDLDDEGAYDLSKLEFCTTPNDDGTSSFVYTPDWPVEKNFFAGKKNDYTKSATITIRAPEVGIEGLEVDIPESVVVYNEQGFEPVLEGETAAQDLWSISAMQGCFDDAGGSETLDDVALTFAWDHSTISEQDGTFECDEAGELCAQSTYVRLTLTSLSLNWFGTVGYPVRATIVASDGGPRDERPTLEVPSSVLYQFPTVRLPAGGGPGGGGLLSSTTSDWGYIVVTFERVTDYSIRTDAGGTVVFSYTTGDFGFFGWDNPTDADGCHNCLDDDGDGWSDSDDPDCLAGGTEETGPGEAACNDGEDNDGDGFSDGRDASCESGSDTDESNCSNETDDDADSLVDLDDPDCLAGGNEGDSEPVDACADGVDGDSDGWVDLEDPDCLSGASETGFGETACNDNDDNDADGVADALDPDCDAAEDTEESAAAATGCTDGLDGDLDGWPDLDDPDCATGTEELGFGTTACNDALDNDLDLTFDALDPECDDASDDDEGA
ncbi:MAG: IPT/TIG domain-containing protein [Pseudomonadota bacterium]|nr:IPT/TIG domain-containing protein [Pseudomonadota bacterium]